MKPSLLQQQCVHCCMCADYPMADYPIKQHIYCTVGYSLQPIILSLN